MTIELTRVEIKQKPWGSTDLLPWNYTSMDGEPVGESWFQRTDATAPDTALVPAAPRQRDANVEQNSSLAPSIAALSKIIAPKEPEAQT